MNNAKNFKMYKQLKSDLDFEYRGFNVGEVLAFNLILSAYDIQKWHTLDIVKNILKLKPLDKILCQIDDKKNLFTYIIPRKDYLALIQQYISKLAIDNQVLQIKKDETLIRLGVKHFFPSFKEIYHLKKKYSYMELAYLWSLIIFYKKMIDSILAVECSLPKAYYAFNCAVDFETLLTIYFKKKGIKTYSLQHGFDYCTNPPLWNIINFDNFVADTKLCWGQYTIDEMIKCGVRAERLEEFGNPQYTYCIPYKKEKAPFNKCLVLLSRIEFEKGNEKLLNVLTQFPQIEFELKLHPTLSQEKYKEFANQSLNITVHPNEILVTQLFKRDYSFVITYNSTTHYESLANGLLTFGFDYKHDGGILLEKFYTYDDLARIIDIYQKKPSLEINKAITSLVYYTLGLNCTSK